MSSLRPHHAPSKAWILGLSLLALGGASSFGQASKPIEALPPGFQFAGTWQCEGTFRSGTLHRAEFTGAIILGGKWLELTERDIAPATGYVAKYLIGYDAQANHLVEFDANNFGAAVYTSDSGWQNGSLTMTSPISTDPKAAYAANRFIYAVANDSFSVDWQISKTSDLTWAQANHLTCKRPSSPA